MPSRSALPLRTDRSGVMAIEQRFDPKGSSVRSARQFVARALEDASYGGDADTVLLLASEIVTNAVRHAGTPFVLSVMVDRRWIAVRVEDEDSAHLLVSPQENGQAVAGSGHGLRILDQLADTWGVEVGEHAKAVWFTAS